MSETPRPDLSKAAELGIPVEGRSTQDVFNDIVEKMAQMSKPAVPIIPPVPTTFTLEGSMFNYELKGVWDEKCAAENGSYDPEGIKQFAQAPAEMIREVMSQGMEVMFANDKNKEWLGKQAPVETLEVASKAPDNAMIKVLVHRPSAPASGPRKCIIYAHGGGAIASSAAAYGCLMARYAVENDAVVCSIDYRLAPEHKAPTGIQDAMGAILHVTSNAEALGIDPSRVALAGESGGAYIIVGALNELLRQGHNDLVKLCMPIIPMNVTDFFKRVPADEMPAGTLAQVMAPFQLALEAHLTPDPPCDKKYLYVAPEPEIVSNFPMTAIMTSEFDFYRDCAQELAAMLHKHGRLVEWCVHPGTTHGWYFDFSHPTSDVFWRDSKMIFDKFL